MYNTLFKSTINQQLHIAQYLKRFDNFTYKNCYLPINEFLQKWSKFNQNTNAQFANNGKSDACVWHQALKLSFITYANNYENTLDFSKYTYITRTVMNDITKLSNMLTYKTIDNSIFTDEENYLFDKLLGNYTRNVYKITSVETIDTAGNYVQICAEHFDKVGVNIISNKVYYCENDTLATSSCETITLHKDDIILKFMYMIVGNNELVGNFLPIRQDEMCTLNAYIAINKYIINLHKKMKRDVIILKVSDN